MIKLISKTVFVLVLICSVVNTYGQKKLMEKLAAKSMDRIAKTKEKMKTTELVIVLMENNDKSSSYHKEVVSNYNTFIKELADEYISFFKGIKYKKVSEIASMSQSDRKKYFFMCYNKASVTNGGKEVPFNVYDEIEAGKEDKFLKHYKKTEIKENTAWVKLDIYGFEDGSAKYVGVVNMPEVMPVKWNMIYALSSLKSYYGERTKTVNQLINKNKVLLICKEDLHKKMLEGEIKKYYKNKYEVVSRADYAKAIEEKDDKYIYVVTSPLRMSPTNSSNAITVSSIIYANMYIECSSGVNVGMTTISGSMGAVGASATRKINKNSLKKIYKQFSVYMK